MKIHKKEEVKTTKQLHQLLVNHFDSPDKFAFEGNRCRYRTTTGLACAVGLFLPDEIAEYADIDGGGVEDLNFEAMEFLPLGDQTLWVEIQNAHDDAAQVAESERVDSFRLFLDEVFDDNIPSW